MEPSGAEWSRVEPSGAEWCRMEPSGAVWSRVVPRRRQSGRTAGEPTLGVRIRGGSSWGEYSFIFA